VFRDFDVDKSGSISYEEFRRALHAMNIHLEDDEFAKLCTGEPGSECVLFSL
jgi:Ca2+-binding EF-hand superfamily protein